MTDSDSLEEMRLVNNIQPIYSYTEIGEEDDVQFDLSEMQHRDKMAIPKHDGKTRTTEQLKDLHENEVNIPKAYETALSEAGFGRYQIQLFFVLGLGIMADGVEVFLMGYVLSSADRELCLSDWEKGWLSGMVFVGMLIGALTWGYVSDRIGRRHTLIICLSVNAIFAFSSAFVQTFVQFLVFRFGAGIGVGGSIPVAYSYYGEFTPREHRASHLSWLNIFYGIAGVFAAAMGLAIIPTNGMAGKCTEATDVLAEVYKQNHGSSGVNMYEERTADNFKYSNKITCDESGVNAKELLTPYGKCGEIFDSFIGLFQQPLVVITFLLMTGWFSSSYGFYGLTLWFPEYIKRIQIAEYFSNTETTRKESFADMAFTDDITNRMFYNVTFQNVTFENLHMENANFHGSEFIDVVFQDVTSAGTYFYNCDFHSTIFNSTNFYDNRFINATMNQTLFMNTRGGCELDFSLSYNASRVYLEILIAMLGGIPGVVISALLMDKIGPKIICMSSAGFSAVSVFFIWFINTEISAAVMLSAVQCFAFGFLTAIARIGGFLGNVTFGRYIGVNKSIPLLLAAFIFFVGGGVSLILPNIKGVLLL
uniref:Synaptic vesicle glycoprotein 2C-like n=1 Tax=Saccoglossus kowalevskii TaxID=10224 RepID=A0ABM0MW14_SACKO|nr:PREDICTED: synaptic vesicle glycoprotein 2C-like [Saccoglossus kowalevskii]